MNASSPLHNCEAAPQNFSPDGYIRLTFEAFTQLAFTHRLAWEDPELRHELCAESFPAHRAGYCEWDTEGKRAVSIGWTWFSIADGSIFVAPGCVSSNVMLVTHNSYDIGAFKTSELLRAWLSSTHWQPGKLCKELRA